MNATDTDDADHEGASVISMIIWNTSMTWVVMTNELGKYFLSYTWLFDWYGGKFIQQSTKMIEKSHLSFSGSSFCKKNSCLIVHFITVDCDGFLFHLPMLIQCSCNSWLSGSGSFAMVDSVGPSRIGMEVADELPGTNKLLYSIYTIYHMESIDSLTRVVSLYRDIVLFLFDCYFLYRLRVSCWRCHIYF
jgi:hypothetical protein